MKKSFEINSEIILMEYGKRQIPLEQITHLEANINYTTIFLADGKKIISAFTLKKFNSLVEKGSFFKIHKSFIINLLYLKSYQPNESKIILEGDRNAKVSRRIKPSLENLILTK